MRRPRPYPVCRRRSSVVMASRSIASPAGTPSRTATSALPCDSPAVRKRSIRVSFYPKKLPHPGRDPAISFAIDAGDDLAPSLPSYRQRRSPCSSWRIALRCTTTNAAGCLRSAGLAATGSIAVRVGQGSPVVVPDIGGGDIGDTEPETAADVPLAVRGLMTIQRSAVPALAELFAYVPGPRPHVAAVWGAPGSGKTTLAIELARLARLNGFVPIAARFIDSTYDALWRGRSVFVVDDGENRRSCPLVHASMQSPVPHVLFVAGAEEIGRVRGLPLGRVSADDLVGAVFPRRMSEALETDARAAAEAARGLPERFLRLLWSDSVGRHRRRAPRTSSRAAEQP